MAVRQNKKSSSKCSMHRSRDFPTAAPTAVESIIGEVRLRHHVSLDGCYRDRKITKTKSG